VLTIVISYFGLLSFRNSIFLKTNVCNEFSYRLQACCWTPTISGLEDHDYAVCLAINATGKVAVVSKYGQVFAAELGVIGSQPKSLALNNSVEFSALILTRELDFMSSTQMFSKYYSVKCARWGGMF
jgi:hypothetical protein